MTENDVHETSTWPSHPSSYVSMELVSGNAARTDLDLLQRRIDLPSSLNDVSLNMRVAYASSPCAVSLINSYATGIGALLAIKDRIEVITIAANKRTSRKRGTARVFNGTDHYLSRCAGSAFNRLASVVRTPVRIRVDIRNSCPPGKGLKTSSALAAAFISSLYAINERLIDPVEIVKISTEAARAANVTQAGSVDDAFGALLGGVVVAQTNPIRLIERWDAPDDIEVLILIPAGPPPRVHRLDRVALLRPEANRFAALTEELLSTGNIFEAATEASFLTARAFEYSTEILKSALHAGALAVMVSGKGPATGALVRKGMADSVIEAWEGYAGTIIRTQPDNNGTVASVKNGALQPSSVETLVA
jgi:shikimate kinase